jgi:hypothetical protein
VILQQKWKKHQMSWVSSNSIIVLSVIPIEFTKLFCNKSQHTSFKICYTSLIPVGSYHSYNDVNLHKRKRRAKLNQSFCWGGGMGSLCTDCATRCQIVFIEITFEIWGYCLTNINIFWYVTRWTFSERYQMA